jgi:hypothetical protein
MVDMTYEDRDILETVDGATILGKALSILQHKSNLDNSSQSNSHQSVAKHCVGNRANMELLGMRRHSPAGHKNNKAGNEVSLWVSISVSAQPNADKACGPPNHSHGGMLPVILYPVFTPSVFSERIDTSPSRNDGAVIKLLGSSAVSNPNLTNNKNNGENNTIGDKGASHNELGPALADMVTLADTKCRNSAKNHLRPCEDRHKLANDGMARPNQFANLSIDALFPVALEIESQNDLRGEEELKDMGECSMDVIRNEFSTLVRVAQEKADNCENRADRLRGNVPTVFGNLLLLVTTPDGPAVNLLQEPFQLER